MEKKRKYFSGASCCGYHYLLPVSQHKSRFSAGRSPFSTKDRLSDSVLCRSERRSRDVVVGPKGSRVLEEMQKVPSSSRYSGICEYRKAEDYGYACDFLVSYGDNVGSSFEISYSPIIDSELQIWCCSGGAILEIRNRDKEPIYFDSCSEVGVLESVELCSARLKTLCLGSAALVVWAACALALYCVLPVLAGKPLPVGGRTDDASIGLARTTAAFLVAYV